MGREVRRVSKNWEHPKNDKGSYVPLRGSSFGEVLARWNEGNEMWNKGLSKNYGDGEKWIPRDEKPQASDYMPDWPEPERTHLQMYEDTTEGTPISPVMETPEELARWLADNRASAFGSQTATYEQWLATIKRGSAV